MQVIMTITSVVFTRIVEDCGESELGDLAQQIQMQIEDLANFIKLNKSRRVAVALI